MTAETSTETVDTSTEETSGQEVENNTDTSDTTSETEENGTQQESSASQQDTRLPDDHPLVKAYASTQDQLKQLKGTHQSKVQELETQVTELTAKATGADALQARYDRLEAFLTSLGGPISKALDSKSFSASLFESDTDIKDLVSQWHKDNPSATSAALNSSAGTKGPAKDMNELLRKAAR